MSFKKAKEALAAVRDAISVEMERGEIEEVRADAEKIQQLCFEAINSKDALATSNPDADAEAPDPADEDKGADDKGADDKGADDKGADKKGKKGK